MMLKLMLAVDSKSHLKSLYGLLMQKIAAGGIEGLQVLCSLLHAVKVQAELAAGAQAEPGQAQRGGQRDADAGRADGQRCQIAQLVPCRQPGSPQLQPRTSKDAAWGNPGLGTRQSGDGLYGFRLQMLLCA